MILVLMVIYIIVICYDMAVIAIIDIIAIGY